jgi:hypothetical protein
MATDLARKIWSWARVDRDEATRLDLALAAAVMVLLALVVFGANLLDPESRLGAQTRRAEASGGAPAAAAAARTTRVE